MTDAFVEAPAEPAHDPRQIIAAVILGIAATLTAIAAYNAALADGDALSGYTTASLHLNDANGFYAQGNVTSAADQTVFIQYAVAIQNDQTDLAAYLYNFMRPELQAAVDWFADNDEATTPFEDIEGNPYDIADFTTARELEDSAAASYKAGSAADEQGDKFELAVVLFALTLFFGGIATLFGRKAVTNALLVMAGVTLSLGAIRLVTAF